MYYITKYAKKSKKALAFWFWWVYNKHKKR